MATPDFRQRIFDNQGLGPKFMTNLVPIRHYVGEIALYPFRVDELPDCVYFCGGDLYALDSPQGIVLNGLSANYKKDWGIKAEDGYINVPYLLDANGNGYFFRPVDGTTRLPGSKQTDAIRNIKTTAEDKTNNVGYGSPYTHANYRSVTTEPLDPPFYNIVTHHNGYSLNILTGGNARTLFMGFDASLCNNVPTAPENRPVNVGMIAGISLGVPKNAS
jgi:hypothetical protein